MSRSSFPPPIELEVTRVVFAAGRALQRDRPRGAELISWGVYGERLRPPRSLARRRQRRRPGAARATLRLAVRVLRVEVRPGRRRSRAAHAARVRGLEGA